MKTEKRIHRGWQEYQDKILPRFPEMDCVFGKYQYIFTSEKGEVSCVELPNFMGDGYDWEIWSNEKLFKDVQRFKTFKEAKEKARKYLD
jgi:hypothetical protein